MSPRTSPVSSRPTGTVEAQPVAAQPVHLPHSRGDPELRANASSRVSCPQPALDPRENPLPAWTGKEAAHLRGERTLFSQVVHSNPSLSRQPLSWLTGLRQGWQIHGKPLPSMAKEDSCQRKTFYDWGAKPKLHAKHRSRSTRHGSISHVQLLASSNLAGVTGFYCVAFLWSLASS